MEIIPSSRGEENRAALTTAEEDVNPRCYSWISRRSLTSLRLPSYIVKQPGITDKQRLLVAASWKTLTEEDSPVFIEHRKTHPDCMSTVMMIHNVFFDELDRLDPSARRTFGSGNIAHEARMMATALSSLVRLFEDNKPLEAQSRLAEVGRHHTRLGVEPEHYEAFGKALLYAIEIALGDAWIPELQEAWLEVYSFVVAIMITAQTTRNDRFFGRLMQIFVRMPCAWNFMERRLQRRILRNMRAIDAADSRSGGARGPKCSSDNAEDGETVRSEGEEKMCEREEKASGGEQQTESGGKEEIAIDEVGTQFVVEAAAATSETCDFHGAAISQRSDNKESASEERRSCGKEEKCGGKEEKCSGKEEKCSGKEEKGCDKGHKMIEKEGSGKESKVIAGVGSDKEGKVISEGGSGKGDKMVAEDGSGKECEVIAEGGSGKEEHAIAEEGSGKDGKAISGGGSQHIILAAKSCH